MDLLTVLAPWCARYGVELVDERVPGVPRTFAPISLMLHHDASPAGALRGRTTPIICKGREGLPGPLGNFHVPRNSDPAKPTIIVTTDGYARDSGMGDPDVLEAVRRQTGATPQLPKPDDRDGHEVNGNPWFYDVEVANNGLGEGYQQGQLDAVVVIGAALCEAHAWPTGRILHHRQWTRRKIDMSYRGDLWTPVNYRRLDFRGIGWPAPVNPYATIEEDLMANLPYPVPFIEAEKCAQLVRDLYAEVGVLIGQPEPDPGGFDYWLQFGLDHGPQALRGSFVGIVMHQVEQAK